MLRRALSSIMAGGLTLIIACSAHAGSTFIFNPNQTYKGTFHSPFAGLDGLIVEKFEDGKANAGGLTFKNGHVRGPSGKTDSVDADKDGINNSGKAGHSYTSGSKKWMAINFANNGQGNRPTAAGFVFTDGAPNSKVKVKAWNAAGQLIAQIQVTLGDLLRNGSTGEDRFFGIMSEEGIKKIQIASNRAGFEIDHVQFTYASNFSVMPLPTPLTLGALGLACAVLMRWRIFRAAS